MIMVPWRTSIFLSTCLSISGALRELKSVLGCCCFRRRFASGFSQRNEFQVLGFGSSMLIGFAAFENVPFNTLDSWIILVFGVLGCCSVKPYIKPSSLQIKFVKNLQTSFFLLAHNRWVIQHSTFK